MKKKTLYLILGIPMLLVLIGAGILYAKLELDFPANRNGHQDFLQATKVDIVNTHVFIRYTGWEDTQTYFRFKANADEIQQVVKSRNLKPDNNFITARVSFYWWKPKVMDKCEYYSEKVGEEWTWLYYNPQSKDSYLFSTTF